MARRQVVAAERVRDALYPLAKHGLSTWDLDAVMRPPLAALRRARLALAALLEEERRMHARARLERMWAQEEAEFRRRRQERTYTPMPNFGKRERRKSQSDAYAISGDTVVRKLASRGSAMLT